MYRLIGTILLMGALAALPVPAQSTEIDSGFFKENERRIEVTTEDGVTIVATYFGPVSDRSPDPVVIMLHDKGADRHALLEYARMVNLKGYTVVTPDLRGFGESTQKQDGKFRAYDKFGDTAFFRGAVKDVGAILDYVAEQPGVYPHQVAIIGTGLGANIGALAASSYPKHVKAVQLLSPLKEGEGIAIVSALEQLGEVPVQVLGDSKDESFQEAVKAIHNVDGNRNIEIHTEDDAGQGVALMKGIRAFDDYSIGFLAKHIWVRQEISFDE